MRALLTLVAIVSAIVLSCSEPPPQQAEPAAGQPAQPAATPPALESQRYEGIGVIEAIDLAQGKVTLAHQDIEGFMKAMTMVFDVQDPAMLSELEEGIEVSFSVVVESDGTYYIDRIDER